VYRATWNRVRQYWTEERWIRVTDDERNLKWVALNQQTIDPETGLPSVQNAIAELDVDIVLEDGPDSVTIQAEQYQMLVDLKKADPTIPTVAVIEASQLRNKDKLIEMMQQGGIPPELQQQMQGLQEQLQQAQQDLQACQQQLQQADQQKGADKAEAQAIRSQIQSDIKVAAANMSAREAQLDAAIARWEAQQAKATTGQDAQHNQGS
jgi:hypothetical protein